MADKLRALAHSLHVYERKLLPLLEKVQTVPELAAASGLSETEVLRGLQWLANKGCLELKTELREMVRLGPLGLAALESGLPERRALSALAAAPLRLAALATEAVLDKQELSVALGSLKAIGAIELTDGTAKLTARGRELLERPLPEESLVTKLGERAMEVDELSEAEKGLLEGMRRRRGLIRITLIKAKRASLTALGRQLAALKLELDVVDRLTPEMLAAGTWRKAKFRAYDVAINVPRVWPARAQHYRAFLDGIRRKFLSLGFTEMDGPLVESTFWDLDALFIPQDHPAREIHDIYYVVAPARVALDRAILERVKAAHERGVAGSKGWRYAYNEKLAARTLLRSQGTACTARLLASKAISIPGKYFGITRCFRPDVVDATHNADFYQTEGIIIEPALTLRHLFGLLRLFAAQFAKTEEIKIVPSYFPFTEPSCELFARHPEFGWIELGGAGMLRPEVVRPLLGRAMTVLAWGLGIDRLAMFALGFKDIRALFSRDLSLLRRTRTV